MASNEHKDELLPERGTKPHSARSEFEFLPVPGSFSASTASEYEILPPTGSYSGSYSAESRILPPRGSFSLLVCHKGGFFPLPLTLHIRNSEFSEPARDAFTEHERKACGARTNHKEATWKSGI